VVFATDPEDDNSLDVIAINGTSNTVVVLGGDGKGHLQRFGSIPLIGAGPNSGLSVDLDRNGFPDGITLNAVSKDLSVLLNYGPLNVSNVPDIEPIQSNPTNINPPAGGGPNNLRAADLDGDGQIDLVFANHDDSSVEIYLNTTPAQTDPLTVALSLRAVVV